ncbi:hypothetical protein Tco_1401476 [Tanacetum coccineum]
MADANINAPEAPVAADFPPTHSDEQILPHDKWVPVGKSNCFLDVERTQANPIFKIAVDILRNTNFFRAFTASSTIPSIYIQQFWNTIKFDKDKGYSCQLDEKRFYLTKATLRDDKMNLALYAEGEKKLNLLVILGVRFTKLIINHLQSKHKFYKRPNSPLHLPTEESALGYLKFSFKNTKRVRLGMAILDILISEEIQTAAYYSEYVAKVTKYQRTPQLVDEFVDEGVPDKEPMHVFREPDTGKIQPLLDVEGKGKEKFEPSGLVESLSLYVELGLTDSRTDSDEEVSPDMNAQGQEEGHGGTNPGDAGVSQTPSSHVVYAGPNLDHMDLGIAEASSQPNTEQMDDEFTSTAYPKVQENLKLLTKGDVRLEEPASSTKTLSSMKNLDKEFSFTDQFLDTSFVPLMTTPVIDTTDPQSDSTTVPASMPTTTTTVTETTTTTTVPPPPPQPQQDVSTSILTQTIGQLEQNIADLVDANQALEERLDK